MAATPWLRASHILWLACLLPLAAAEEATGQYELRLVTDSPATTGALVNITAILEVKEDSSPAMPASTQAYRFHWVHSPLLLTGKADEALRSTIHVVSSTPGDFAVSVWVTPADCQQCQPLARSRVFIAFTESIVGKLVVSHNTPLSWPSSYLTRIVLKTSFLLHDPSNFFQTASFLYNWEFDDSTQMVTEDSNAYYNRSIMGTFKAKLKVVAEWEQPAGKGVVQKTGHFSGTLRLQETLRGIQIVGPTEVEVLQELPMTLTFLGSPPLKMCWGIRSECLPLEDHECRQLAVAGTAYTITTIMMDPGDYCFSIRAENIVSKAHQYHRVQVLPPQIQPAAFAFPCATVITIMLALVMYITLKDTSVPKDSTEKRESPKCCCQLCYIPEEPKTRAEYLDVAHENQELLPPASKPAKTYTV